MNRNSFQNIRMHFACIKEKYFWIDTNSRTTHINTICLVRHDFDPFRYFEQNLYQEWTTKMMCNMQFYPLSVCVIELLRVSLVLFPFYSSNKILLCIDLNRFVYFLLLTFAVMSWKSFSFAFLFFFFQFYFLTLLDIHEFRISSHFVCMYLLLIPTLFEKWHIVKA